MSRGLPRLPLAASSSVPSSELLHALGAGEPVERDVPRIAGDDRLQPLHRPADADQLGAVFLQVAPARGRNGPCRGLAGCRARRPRSAARGSGRAPRPALGDWAAGSRTGRLDRIAGEEAERLGGVGESGKGDDPADRARFLHRQHRADLAAQRRIAADDRRCAHSEVRCSASCLLEGARWASSSVRDERLARVEGGAARGQPLREVEGK